MKKKLKDPICPTCKKPITDEDAVMHHNCLPPVTLDDVIEAMPSANFHAINVPGQEPPAREWYLTGQYPNVMYALNRKPDDDYVRVIEYGAFLFACAQRDNLMTALASCRSQLEVITVDRRACIDSLEAQLAACTARKDEYLLRCQEYSTTIAALGAERDEFAQFEKQQRERAEKAEAEVKRLHDKYDLQLLVRRSESLEAENLALRERNAADDKAAKIVEADRDRLQAENELWKGELLLSRDPSLVTYGEIQADRDAWRTCAEQLEIENKRLLEVISRHERRLGLLDE